MTTNSRTRLGAVAVAAVLAAATAARAQYLVYDPWSVEQMVAQVQQSIQQVTTLQQQLTQAQQLYGSINKLTSMGDIATVLKDPNIRQVLPQSFSQVEGALTGQGTGAIGTSASSFLSQNSTYTTPGNDFYAQQLKATANNNAGTLGIAQQFYDAATTRISGIQQLQDQIGQAPDQATKLDLQNRLQSEVAFLQIDQQRIQALAMVQQAQLEVARQKEKEEWRQRLDTIQGTSPLGN